MQKSSINRKFIITTILLFFSLLVKGQTTDALGTYTPYSLFGIGEIEKQGTALNKGMGGIGIGLRDNRYINYLNPAAITERDTLSFMLDFGIHQKNFYNSDGNTKSAYNTFNMQNVIFTAPIYKKSALIVGIAPYSNIGYKFESTESNNNLVAEYGDIKYQKYGTGSINQFFIGAAMNLSKNFSLGAEFTYYFGAINKYSNINFADASAQRSVKTGWDYSLSAVSGRLGLQYFGKVGNNKELTIGATLRKKTKLKGEMLQYAYASSSSVTDTIRHNLLKDYKVIIPNEVAFGFSLRSIDKWLIGADYIYQNWEKASLSSIPGISFIPTASHNVKLGVEYIPNKYDIRYYMKRVTYRAGAYFEQTYINVNGKQVNAAGITFGMALPIYRWYNAINWSLDFGQRGMLQRDMVRERYVQLNLNISLHDLWFIKKKYQ